MKKLLSNPALVFAILAFLIGGAYCVVVPYGAGFDEAEHITRIYDIAANRLVPNRNPPNYKTTVTLREFFDLAYQRRYTQSPAFDMYEPASFSRKFSRLEEDVVYGYQTRSIYSPVMFLPQALAAKALWRMADFPIFPGVILIRLAGLAMYIALIYFAIRLLPFGQWVMAALALSPMAIYQAATLNADGYTNGVSFLFVGAVLGVYVKPQIGMKWILTLAGISVLLGFAKPGVVLLLPLLLLLNKARFSSPWHLPLLVVGAALSLFANVGWTALAVDNSHLSGGGGQSISVQLGLILNAPLDFIVSFLSTTWLSLPSYFQNWAAAYGYWAGEVPGLVYWGYALLLLAALLAEPASLPVARNARIFIAGLFLFSAGATAGMYFVANYTPGASEILGGQGRYFIPFAPLLFLSVAGLANLPTRWLKLTRWLVMTSFALTLGFYTFGIYTTYYTYCGYEAYAGKQCILPIYKNLNRENPPEIRVGPNTIQQVFTSQCANLQGVDVLVKSAPKKGRGALQISVLDENQQVLASEQIPFERIQPDEYLALSIPPQSGEKGRQFTIELKAGKPSGIGFGINQFELADVQLWVNDEMAHGSLIFHYTCARP